MESLGQCRSRRVMPVTGLVLAGMVSLSCAGSRPLPADPATDAKIHLDLSKLDVEGLLGPANGKRAMGFEFCIPARGDCERQVREIDPRIAVQRGARGRIGCGEGQLLCVGSTHRTDYRRILQKLASLPYVERIEEFIPE
jgi:hypothetical protein